MGLEYVLQIFFIGDKTVGRRTFLKEVLNAKHFNREGKETVGVDIYKKEVRFDGKGVNLMIHDVSSKEHWKSLLKVYLSGSNGAILMFDVSNLKSLEYLFPFPKMIRERAGEIPILLLGNKIDLIKERAVSRERGMAFARDNNLLGYIEISASTGQGCEGIFKLLVEKIITQL